MEWRSAPAHRSSWRMRQMWDKKKYADWRRAVYKRDHWTCQLCGRRGGDFEAHHIKMKSRYPELMYEVSNGITLCGPNSNPETCHGKVTRREEAWEELLIWILSVRWRERKPVWRAVKEGATLLELREFLPHPYRYIPLPGAPETSWP